MRGNYVATLHYKATDIKHINIGSAIQKLQQFELFALRVRGVRYLKCPQVSQFGANRCPLGPKMLFRPQPSK
jgi:hypothetical protein